MAAARAMDDEEEYLLLLIVSIRRASKRRIWIHDIIKKREELGEFHRLVQELKLDSERFRIYFRITPVMFEELLSLIAPHISPSSTNYRKTIKAEERLAICLR